MYTLTNPTELTADDVKALRKADTVSFHTNEDGTFIRASFKDDVVTKTNADLFPVRNNRARERQIVIDHESYDAFYAFAMVHTAQYSRTFQSIARLLRKGDFIALRWGKDSNTNETLRKAGLHADQLDVVIYRGKAGTDPLVFTVETSVCPDNTARMIRNRAGW